MDNRIGLRQLRAFHAVMTTGNVTAAAQNLNLTQPAVSKQLTALEHSLGITLFHRKSGSATSATREGIAFFKASEATISGLEELPMIARDMAPDHVLSEEDVLTPETVQGHQVILPSHQLLRCRIEEALKTSGDSLRVGMEASSSLTCCHMAASGLGVAICDPYSPSTFPQSLLTVRAWQPEVPLSYGALMPKDVDLSRPAARFLDLLEQSFSMPHQSGSSRGPG